MKSGISSESQEAAIAEDENPFQELQNEIDDPASVQPELFAEYMDAAFFTDVDEEVATVQPPPTDAEIVAGLLDTEIDGKCQR